MATDITSTGAQNYRELQAQNNAGKIDSTPQTEEERAQEQEREQQDYNDIRSAFGYVGHRTTAGEDYLAENNTEIESPLMQSTDYDYWGRSMWDDQIADESQFQHLGDVRANNQWGIAKLGAGVVKGAITAGTTFVNGTVGLLVGAATAIGEQRWSGLWDNGITKAMDAVNEWSERDLAPNYYTEEEQNAAWYENAFSGDWHRLANFWGDHFIKNFGFTIGAMYSGGIWSSAGALLGKGGAKLLGAISKARKVKKGVDALAKCEQSVQAMSGCSDITKMIVGGITAAEGEGAIEAYNNTKDWVKTQNMQLEDEYNRQVSALDEQYAGMSPDDPRMAEYQQRRAELDKGYQEGLQKTQVLARKMGNRILMANIPILTVSDIFTFGKIFTGNWVKEGINKYIGAAAAGKVIDAAGKEAATGGIKGLAKSIGSKLPFGKKEAVKAATTAGEKKAAATAATTAVAEGAEKAATAAAGKGAVATAEKGAVQAATQGGNRAWVEQVRSIGKDKALKLGAKGLMEGTEEVSQGLIAAVTGNYYENKFHDYYMSKFDPDAEKKSVSWINAIGNGIAQTFGDQGTGEEFFLGAVTGMLGIPGFKAYTKADGTTGHKLVMQEGIFGAIQEYKRDSAAVQAAINHINTTMNNPNFRSQYQGIIRHEFFQSRMDRAAQEGDQKAYRDAATAQLMSDVQMFADAGQLEMLKHKISDEVFGEDEQSLREIIEMTTSVQKMSDGSVRLRGPLAEYASYDYENDKIDASLGNEESLGKVREVIQKNKQDILDQIDSFAKAKDMLDSRFGDQLNNDQREELMYMMGMQENWKKRIKDILTKDRTATILDAAKQGMAHQRDELQAKIDLSYPTDELKKSDAAKADLEELKKLSSALDLISKSEEANTAGNISVNGIAMAAAYLRQNPAFAHSLQSALDEDITDFIIDVADACQMFSDLEKFGVKLAVYLAHPELMQQDQEALKKAAEERVAKEKAQEEERAKQAAADISGAGGPVVTVSMEEGEKEQAEKEGQKIANSEVNTKTKQGLAAKVEEIGKRKGDDHKYVHDGSQVLGFDKSKSTADRVESFTDVVSKFVDSIKKGNVRSQLDTLLSATIDNIEKDISSEEKKKQDPKVWAALKNFIGTYRKTGKLDWSIFDKISREEREASPLWHYVEDLAALKMVMDQFAKEQEEYDKTHKVIETALQGGGEPGADPTTGTTGSNDPDTTDKGTGDAFSGEQTKPATISDENIIFYANETRKVLDKYLKAVERLVQELLSQTGAKDDPDKFPTPIKECYEEASKIYILLQEADKAVEEIQKEEKAGKKPSIEKLFKAVDLIQEADQDVSSHYGSDFVSRQIELADADEDITVDERIEWKMLVLKVRETITSLKENGRKNEEGTSLSNEIYNIFYRDGKGVLLGGYRMSFTINDEYEIIREEYSPTASERGKSIITLGNEERVAFVDAQTRKVIRKGKAVRLIYDPNLDPAKQQDQQEQKAAQEKKQDDDDFAKAVQTRTLEAYREYLDKHPDGLHKVEAAYKIIDIQQKNQNTTRTNIASVQRKIQYKIGKNWIPYTYIKDSNGEKIIQIKDGRSNDITSTKTGQRILKQIHDAKENVDSTIETKSLKAEAASATINWPKTLTKYTDSITKLVDKLKGETTDEARKKQIDEIASELNTAIEQAAQEGSSKPIIDFIDKHLNYHTDDVYRDFAGAIDDAMEEFAEQDWEEALKENTYDAYQKYNTYYIRGIHKLEAIASRDFLNCIDKGEKELQEFIDKFNDSTLDERRTEHIERLIALAEEKLQAIKAAKDVLGASLVVKTKKTVEKEKDDGMPAVDDQGIIHFYTPTLSEWVTDSKTHQRRPFDREKDKYLVHLHDYLVQKGAFEFINSGQLKPGEKVYFIIDPDYTYTEQGQEKVSRTIFMAVKRDDAPNGYQIFGALSRPVDANVNGKTGVNKRSQFEGLTTLTQKINDEFYHSNYNVHDARGYYVYGANNNFPQGTVSMIATVVHGQCDASDTFDQSLNTACEASGVNPSHVKLARVDLSDGTKKDIVNMSDEEVDQIIGDFSQYGNNGFLFCVCLKNPSVDRYTALPVVISRFSEKDWNINDADKANSEIGRQINDAIDSIVNASDNKTANEAIKKLYGIFALSSYGYHLNAGKKKSGQRVLIISRKTGETDDQGREKSELIRSINLDGDTKIVRNLIVTALQRLNGGKGIIFNINKKAAKSQLKNWVTSGVFRTMLKSFDFKDNAPIIRALRDDGSIDEEKIKFADTMEQLSAILGTVKPAAKTKVSPAGGTNSVLPGSLVIIDGMEYRMDESGNVYNDKGEPITVPKDISERIHNLLWYQKLKEAGTVSTKENMAVLKEGPTSSDEIIIINTTTGETMSESDSNVKQFADERRKNLNKHVESGRNAMQKILQAQERVEHTANDPENTDAPGMYVIKDEQGQKNKYWRAHTVIYGQKQQQQDDGQPKPALTVGSFVDGIIRDFLHTYFFYSEGNGVDFEQIQKRLKSEDGENSADYIAEWIIKRAENDEVSISEDAAKKLAKQLKDFSMVLAKAGWRPYTDNIVVFGNFNTQKAESLRVAGEIDILCQDEAGDFHIIDIKTSQYSFHSAQGLSENFTGAKNYLNGASPLDAYTQQLNVYRKLVQQFGGEVKDLSILPIQLDYKIKDDGITISSAKIEKGIKINEDSCFDEMTKDGDLASTLIDRFLGKKNATQPTIESLLEQAQTQNQVKFTPEQGPKKQNDATQPTIESLLEQAQTQNQVKFTPEQGPKKQNDATQPTIESLLEQAQTQNQVKFTPEQGPKKQNDAPQNASEPTIKSNSLSPEKDNSDPSDYDSPFRIIDKTIEYQKIDLEEELAWLDKALPQLSREQRIQIHKGLIEVRNHGGEAWGQMRKGMMIISDVAAKGTVYHEAFHVVFRLLLSKEEQLDILDEAHRKWGYALTSLECEERLAEGFREYVMNKSIGMTEKEENGFFATLGRIGRKIKAFFRMLWNLISEPRRNASASYFDPTGEILDNTQEEQRERAQEQEFAPETAQKARDTQDRVLSTSGTVGHRLDRIEQLYKRIDEGFYSKRDLNEKPNAQLKKDVEAILDHFDLKLHEVKDFDSETPLFDVINRTINFKDDQSLLDNMGYAIAFLMQHDPLVKHLLETYASDWNNKVARHFGGLPVIGSKLFRLFSKMSGWKMRPRTLTPNSRQFTLMLIGHDLMESLKEEYGIVDKANIFIDGNRAAMMNIWHGFCLRIANIFGKHKTDPASSLRKIAYAIKRGDYTYLQPLSKKPGNLSAPDAKPITIDTKDLSETDKQKVAFIRQLADHKIYIGGSTSISLAGQRVMRPSNKVFHDIDFYAFEHTQKDIERILKDSGYHIVKTAEMSDTLPLEKIHNRTLSYVVSRIPITTKQRKTTGKYVRNGSIYTYTTTVTDVYRAEDKAQEHPIATVTSHGHDITILDKTVSSADLMMCDFFTLDNPSLAAKAADLAEKLFSKWAKKHLHGTDYGVNKITLGDITIAADPRNAWVAKLQYMRKKDIFDYANAVERNADGTIRTTEEIQHDISEETLVQRLVATPVIYVSPTISRAGLLGNSDMYLEFDSVTADRRKNFITARLRDQGIVDDGTPASHKKFKEAYDKYRKDFENAEYTEFMKSLFDDVVRQAQKEGKQVLVSNEMILHHCGQQIGLYLMDSKRTSVKRNFDYVESTDSEIRELEETENDGVALDDPSYDLDEDVEAQMLSLDSADAELLAQAELRKKLRKLEYGSLSWKNRIDEKISEQAHPFDIVYTEDGLRTFLREKLGLSNWNLLTAEEKKVFKSRKNFYSIPQELRDQMLQCKAF